ncbi:hypothetical protein TraAM80_04205 [Trypanosoma rangeli]|uniref:Uncharacterized protein n=1 Tax=Trypanosoma rangeli TaxID=5698 RepID=A0A3R7KGI5_TRYRA|nr:uncharacterized protein TraAM80_04205 [Trypanosoma rangeli]RNF06051.1 hypothetical protein TraAM80_04205 [Trypanosoma rangeli]|eukprot:RNF06051.1 hypothetical protein TraAM80_04205 [Trypanosoma rangeli]
MHIALGLVAEDAEARRVASAAFTARARPVFRGNNGPFVEVWFGEHKLFGLVERAAPNDFIQVVQVEDADADAADAQLRVAHNVAFVLHLSSVQHAILQARPRSENAFVNGMHLVVEYAALLRHGMQADVLGVEAESGAEYVQFTSD